jgi:hypothetical protein
VPPDARAVEGVRTTPTGDARILVRAAANAYKDGMADVLLGPSESPTSRGRDDAWPRYGLLLLVVVAAVAVQGIAGAGTVQRALVSALLGCSLVLSFRVARLAPALVRSAVAVAVAGVAVAVLGDGGTRVVNALLVALGPPAVAIGVVRSLRASRSVTVQAVMGVLSLYMLIGMLFASVFGAIDRLGGAPFFAGGAPATAARCLYYSFTTLTTVGYGDLAARTDAGHTLSIFEALIGQIYLVTVVSLIVSNLGRRTSRD